MVRKTGMTAKLLLLSVTVYALLSLISLTGALRSAQNARAAAADELTQLQETVAALQNSSLDSVNLEIAARNELKMALAGEKILLPKS